MGFNSGFKGLNICILSRDYYFFVVSLRTLQIDQHILCCMLLKSVRWDVSHVLERIEMHTGFWLGDLEEETFWNT